MTMSVNIKLPAAEESDTLELVDNLEITDAFKKQYLAPYLSSLWESLAGRTWNPDQGIQKFAFTGVFLNPELTLR